MDKNPTLPKKRFPLLLTPGPVSVPGPALRKLSEPMIHHRSPNFINLFTRTQTLLKKIFQTQQPVLVLNSSGTGAMSAALLNTLSPQDKVLALCTGKFGERWAEIAKAYHLNLVTLHTHWGQSVCVQKVKEQLNKHPDIKAVLAQACETSTGALQPIKELASLTKNNSSQLFILDAISALGAVYIPMDQWGIDIIIGGSQKFFSLPAGMSFISLSEKAWSFNKTSRLPVYYLDLKKEKKAQAKGQTAFSSNVSFIKALYEILLPIEKNGLSYFTDKIERLSQITLKFCHSLNLDIFPQTPSPSVTAIALPSHIDGSKLKAKIEKEHGITFGGGQEQLKGKIIRVGHLGNISTSDTIRGLEALALCLHSEDPKLFPMDKIKRAFAQFQSYMDNS